MDASGIIEEVGSGVTRFKKGDEVYGITAGRIAAWAEYSLANEADLMLKPFEMTFDASATLPTGALVALGACRVADVKEGQTVLVNGASGGVGTALVQIIVAMGAKVTAVCSTRNVDMVKEFGVEQVIDYVTEDFTKNAKTYDCIFGVNGYRSLEEYKAALNPGGMYVLVGDMRQGAEFQQRGEAVFRDSGKRLGAVASQMTKSEPDYISSLVAGGKLKPIVDSVYSIQNAANAVRDIVKNHARGKIAIKMDF
jgi:NADPH:quinone reductase-like Zn-dependent oxidoreductase